MYKKQYIIFNPEEIIEAFENPIAEGGNHPLSKVFSIDTEANKFEKASNAALRCTLGEKKNGLLKTRLMKEVQCGQIAPLKDIDLMQMNARRPVDRKIEKRDKKPTLQFQKYKFIEEGEEPDEENASVFYKAFEYVEEYFRTKMTKRMVWIT